jgi:hypothetical protein
MHFHSILPFIVLLEYGIAYNPICFKNLTQNTTSPMSAPHNGPFNDIQVTIQIQFGDLSRSGVIQFTSIANPPSILNSTSTFNSISTAYSTSTACSTSIALCRATGWLNATLGTNKTAGSTFQPTAQPTARSYGIPLIPTIFTGGAAPSKPGIFKWWRH